MQILRSLQGSRRLASGLSNDPRGQLALEFRADSVLYCRELAVDFPNSADPSKHVTYFRVNISDSRCRCLTTKVSGILLDAQT